VPEGRATAPTAMTAAIDGAPDAER